MGFSRSPRAFTDAREILERALEAPKGVRIPCSSRSAATLLRSRLNYYRKIDRAQNKMVYDQDHPLYGQSMYDALILRIPPKGTPGDNILWIEPHSTEGIVIEEIT